MRIFLSRFLLSSWREGLLPLPEGARLSSSSPPPHLPRISPMSLDLPHPVTTPVTETTEGDSTWAATFGPPPPSTTATILGMLTLQHPCPQLAAASSGTILPFHTVPTSQPLATAHLITEHLPQQATDVNIGTSIRSTHSSLYNPSRNPSPVPQPPILISQVAIGRMSETSAPYVAPHVAPHKQVPGSDSPTDSVSSHNLHQSYSHPLSRNMDVGQARQAVWTPFLNTPILPCHSPTRPSSTEPQRPPSRPPSHRAHQPTPDLPPMTLSDAIQFYQRTAMDLSVAILTELKQAPYHELYNYFAYELPFIHVWGETQAGNDYFMKKQQGIPADDILQYEVERNAHLLFNEIHQNPPMNELLPYESIVTKTDIQMLMPDEPPVAPPRPPVTTFSYVRGHEPPGTYSSGYRPFTGGGHGAGQPPPPVQPPVAPV